jgi:predicted Zn-dependent protease
LKQVVRRGPEEERLLSDLWLMSAASFRRAGKLEQSLVAVEEAETRDPENPAVWVQLGLWHRAAGKVDDAQAAFTKSLLLRPDYPPGAVGVARLHVAAGAVDLAHSLLSQLVQDRGWDVPEAWFALARVCERQDRHARARECLLYALQLERTRTCRALPDALPRWSE